MNKIKTRGVAAVIMTIFAISFFSWPTPFTGTQAVVQDRPVVLIDAANGDFDKFPSSYTLFTDTLMKWGYELKYADDNFTAAMFTDVDILVMSKRYSNMTSAALTALSDWFDSGNKSILAGGDGDYGGYVNATYLNNPLEAIGSSIFFERTSVDDSEVNVGGGSYRVRAINYNTETPIAKVLTESLPHGQSVYHGPTAIIGRNSTGDLVTLEDSTGKGLNSDFNVANVEWLIRTSPTGIDVRNTIGTYQAHTNAEENNFTIAATQTFPGIDGKLVLTGETIWSTWKDQFKDPSEYDTKQDNKYLVYAVFNWFSGVLTEYGMPVVLIDAANGDFDKFPSSYTLFTTKLRQWGYEVRLAEDNFTAAMFVDVDILVMSKRYSNMTSAALTALSDWFDSGNKAILAGGDGDYGGYVNATYLNNPLEAIGSSIFFERTSVDDSEVNVGGGSYRVRAINYNDEGVAGTLTSNLPHGQSVYHGPTAIIGRNSTGDLVTLEDSTGKGLNSDFNVANVDWLIRTSPTGIDVRNTIGTYQAHTNAEENNFTIAATQTFPGIDGKLVLTGETIWSTWKDQFKDPSEYDTRQDNQYFVYNILRWFSENIRPQHERTVVLIDAANGDFDKFPSSYSLFTETLLKWGYEVRLAEDNFTAAMFVDVDILVMSKRYSNMTSAALTALSDWFNSGNKAILAGGDGDYGGYVNATYLNNPLEAIGSSIFFERTSVDDSEVNVGGGSYRVRAINYNDEGVAGTLTSSLPHGQSVYHGPTAIIGRNSTGDLVTLEDSTGKGLNSDFNVANVDWLIRTSPTGIDVRNTIGTYQAHTNAEENNFTIAAVQTFPGIDGKLVLTGETIWSTWKDQFKDPSEYDTSQDNRYFVWNVMNWMAPLRTLSFVPQNLLIDSPAMNTLFDVNQVYLNWTLGVFNTEIEQYKIFVDGNVRNTTGKMYFTLKGLTDGLHTISIQAHSVLGFAAYSNEINITVDTTAPVLSIFAPTNETTITEGASLDLTWNASEPTTAVENFEVFVDGVSVVNQTTTSYTITTPAVGAHTVKIVAVDTAGNSEEIVFTFTVEAEVIPTTTTTTTEPEPPTTTTGGAPGFEFLSILTILGFAVIATQRRKK